VLTEIITREEFDELVIETTALRMLIIELAEDVDAVRALLALHLQQHDHDPLPAMVERLDRQAQREWESFIQRP
jgi:hypothetical protein